MQQADKIDSWQQVLAVCTRKVYNEVVLNIEFVCTGGIKRDVPQGWITLDANRSYNPNVGLFNSSYLSFNWTRNDSSVTLLNWKTPKVEINATMFNSSKTFEVTVAVNDTKYGKTANATQVVRIVDSEAPTTEIV